MSVGVSTVVVRKDRTTMNDYASEDQSPMTKITRTVFLIVEGSNEVSGNMSSDISLEHNGDPMQVLRN